MALLRGLAVTRSFRCGFAKLFVETAQIVIADLLRNVDDLFASRQSGCGVCDTQLMTVGARTQTEIAVELSREVCVSNIEPRGERRDGGPD